jgi:hypothetical protein
MGTHTNWDLFAEMVPVISNVSLHHLPTQYMAVIAAVASQKSFLLSCNRYMVRLVEAFFDQVNNLLALLFGQDCFPMACIKQACNSHRVLGLLMIWWEESAKIDIICKIRYVVLIVCIRIAREK